MKTKFLKPSDECLQLAANLLVCGEVVAIPTETVYGLAADSTNAAAIKKIFYAKGRPSDNPLIVHISHFDMFKKVAKTITVDAIKLANAFWPGPLTIIVPKSDFICSAASANLDSVGVRMPSNKTALEIINRAGVPLAAPSANISGKPSPTNAQDVFDDMNGKIPLIIDGGACNAGVESTVISTLGETPIILRPGVVTKEDIKAVLGKKILMAKEITEEATNLDKVLSPGMKYKHYAPNAEVFIVKGSYQQFLKFVNNIDEKDCFAMCFDGEEKQIKIGKISYGDINDDESQAKNLFTILRKLDKLGAKKVYVRCPKCTGVGLAVYNRLLRSAGFKVVDLSLQK